MRKCKVAGLILAGGLLEETGKKSTLHLAMENTDINNLKYFGDEDLSHEHHQPLYGTPPKQRKDMGVQCMVPHSVRHMAKCPCINSAPLLEGRCRYILARG